MKRVLITDYVHPRLFEGLEELGYSVEYNMDFPVEQLESVLPELHGIVINTKTRMTAERIKLAHKLEFIARLGSGLDIIDLEAAKSKGIQVINTPEANCDSVAEHVSGMLLCLSNNLLRADRQVRKLVWQREANRGFELKGKTLGIIGIGHTGKAFSQRMSCWGLEILYYDPYVLGLPSSYSYLQKVSLDELLNKADIISLHVQLTEETKYMVDGHFLDKCKQGAILINSSRGAVVDTEALVLALESGKLAGACLDVFENEKQESFSDKETEMYGRLYQMENVVLSPHIAGWTRESLERIAEVMLHKLGNAL